MTKKVESGYSVAFALFAVMIMSVVCVAKAGLFDALNEGLKSVEKEVGLVTTKVDKSASQASSNASRISERTSAKIKQFKDEIVPLIEKCNAALSSEGSEFLDERDFNSFEIDLQWIVPRSYVRLDRKMKTIALGDDQVLADSVDSNGFWSTTTQSKNSLESLNVHIMRKIKDARLRREEEVKTAQRDAVVCLVTNYLAGSFMIQAKKMIDDGFVQDEKMCWSVVGVEEQSSDRIVVNPPNIPCRVRVPDNLVGVTNWIGKIDASLKKWESCIDSFISLRKRIESCNKRIFDLGGEGYKADRGKELVHQKAEAVRMAFQDIRSSSQTYVTLQIERTNDIDIVTLRDTFSWRLESQSVGQIDVMEFEKNISHCHELLSTCEKRLNELVKARTEEKERHEKEAARQAKELAARKALFESGNEEFKYTAPFRAMEHSLLFKDIPDGASLDWCEMWFSENKIKFTTNRKGRRITFKNDANDVTLYFDGIGDQLGVVSVAIEFSEAVEKELLVGKYKKQYGNRFVYLEKVGDVEWDHNTASDNVIGFERTILYAMGDGNVEVRSTVCSHYGICYLSADTLKGIQLFTSAEEKTKLFEWGNNMVDMSLDVAGKMTIRRGGPVARMSEKEQKILIEKLKEVNAEIGKLKSPNLIRSVQIRSLRAFGIVEDANRKAKEAQERKAEEEKKAKVQKSLEF